MNSAAKALMESSNDSTRADAGKLRAFTLPEYLVTLSLVVIISAGILGAYLFGGRMYALAKAKLSASDDSRVLISKFTHDVRTAALIQVGTGGQTAFSEPADGTPQQGNAVQIFPTSDTNSFVRYFWDPYDQNLKRVESNPTNSSLVVLAHSITNSVVFTSEDFYGNITTNEQYIELVGMTLLFDQAVFQTMKSAADTNTYQDFAELRTRVNKRTSTGYRDLTGP